MHSHNNKFCSESQQQSLIARNRKNVLIGVLLLLCGCAAENEFKDMVFTDPKELYDKGIEELNERSYSQSAAIFEQLEREFPATEYAIDAQIKRAFALYTDAKYFEALAVIDDFVRQFPTYKHTDYMYYLKAMCYYVQIVDSGRDQQLTQDAIDAFETLLNRFPNSNYAKDAKLKKEYAENNLAAKEMDVGRFYLGENNYIAALNRFQVVVEKYEYSIFIEEALYRMVEIYLMLGDKEQAQKYAAVLGHNYPDSTWYKDAYHLMIKP